MKKFLFCFVALLMMASLSLAGMEYSPGMSKERTCMVYDHVPAVVSQVVTTICIFDVSGKLMVMEYRTCQSDLYTTTAALVLLGMVQYKGDYGDRVDVVRYPPNYRQYKGDYGDRVDIVRYPPNYSMGRICNGIGDIS